jgi:hypothetical protein
MVALAGKEEKGKTNNGGRNAGGKEREEPDFCRTMKPLFLEHMIQETWGRSG